MTRQRPLGSRKTSIPRGQALLEYAFLCLVLVVTLAIGGTARVLPGPGGRISLFMALHHSFASHHFLLRSPFP